MLKKTKKFHELTKLKEFDTSTDENPPVSWTRVFYKFYPRLQSINLREGDNYDSFLRELLKMRESARIFSDVPVSFEDVSRILGSCRIIDPTREPEKRTYPSAGARFPIEIYLVAYNIESLDKGVFHYNIKQNQLEILLKTDTTRLRRALFSPYLENPAGTIVFTSVISRSEVKYGYKAYPFSFIEAGHMGQNILLACTEIGLGACPVSGFLDDTIIKLLDLGEGEIPIYTISFGKRKGL